LTSRPSSSPRTVFHFFGGKGGVGKTTCASAFAVARARQGRRVLVVSTDPAHSLRDALGKRLPPRLRAIELDAPRAFARWIDDNRSAAGDVLEHGTWLDRDDIDALLELPIPGVDELVGLIEIDRIARLTPRIPRAGARGVVGARGSSRASSYDVVVIDTAPTGHTLRLLAAPETVRVVADLLDALQEEHRVIRAQLARVGRPEAADRLIEEIARQASAIAGRLRSRDETEFHWVTLPEPLSVAESLDALRVLRGSRIPVPEIIVNRVLTDEGPCPICDRRCVEEHAVIDEIRRTLGKGRAVTLVRAQFREPRGARALASLARDMADGSWLIAERSRRHRSMARTSLSNQPLALSRNPAARPVDIVSLDAVREAKLIFVGGKGGVGKTTVAAAIALSIAHAQPRQRTLLLSTDPAHSLADVFRTPEPNVPGLRVTELDARAAFGARAQEFEAALDEIASKVGVGQGSMASGTADLMKLAPPGIDELFGMLAVFSARDEYDTIVVDTAPTGHALRLLELPDAAREWVQVLLRVLLKYRALVRPGQLAAELVDLSKAIRDLQALLRDARSTRFIVVTRAAQLPRRETERLLARLRRLQLATPALVVNAMTLAPGRCRRCRQTAADERVQFAALERASRGRVIIRTPLAAPAPRGVKALDQWRGSWSS
jgi:arsenite/tail-anchored protein-transporting ATPase